MAKEAHNCIHQIDSDSKWKGHFFCNFTIIMAIFGQLHKYHSQNSGADSNYEGLNVSKNSNWIKMYYANHKFFWQMCASILEEKKLKF